MKKWCVSIPINASAIFTIEAETEEEAIQKAYEEGVPTICHYCSDYVDIEDWTLDGDAVAEALDIG